MSDLALPNNFFDVPEEIARDRLKARIQESFADCLSEKDLKALVDKSIDDFFFRPRPSLETGFYPKLRPPLLEEWMIPLLEASVKPMIEQWVKDHDDILRSHLFDALDINFASAVLKGFSGLIRNEIDAFGNAIRHKLEKISD